jgi:hypothetical protein
LQNAIEKRCIICRWFVVCQFLAAWRRSMSNLAGPAALGDRPRFATSGYVSLGRSQSGVQQPGDSQRFVASADNGARSPDVSAARYPCLAAIGDRQRFVATGHQKRFSANGDRRRSGANSDRQRFAATGRQKRFSANGDRRRSSANSDRQTFGTIGSRHELATACK